MDNNLIVSSSPHLHSGARTRKIMLDVIIALTPATVMAVVFFGLNALLLIAVTTATAVLSEFLFNIIAKRKHQSVGDLSAVVTGLLLALTLPATTALWQAIIGAVFAIVVVKCLFGGIGCNFANPAIAARIMMLISFTNNVAGGTNTTFSDTPLQAGATPLAILGKADAVLPSLTDMLIGNRGGAIGETCAIALLVGFVYLLIKKVISWHIPVVFVGSTFILSFLLGGFNLTASVYHVLGGGLLLGAIFMATDYVTSPITKWGKVIFAFGCALFTVIIRVFGSLPEGVSYAILLMNILATPIEILTAPKALGAAKAKKEGKPNKKVSPFIFNKRNVVTCILLSFLTGGVYLIYWTYLLVRNTHVAQNDTSRCGGEVACILFVPFYSLFWWFTRGKSVKDRLSAYGYPVSGNETIYLILAIFGLSIVSMAIMQSDFNLITTDTLVKNQKGGANNAH